MSQCWTVCGVSQVLSVKAKEALDRIALSVSAVQAVIATPDYPHMFRKYLEAVRENVYDYLMSENGLDHCVSETDTLPIAMSKVQEQYLRIMSNNKLLKSIVDNYDPAKGGFNAYFRKCIKYTAVEQQDDFDAHSGFTDSTKGDTSRLFNTNEERLLSMLIDFLDSRPLTDEIIDEFCGKNPRFSREKLIYVWQKNQATYAVRQSVLINDGDDIKSEIFDIASFDNYIIEQNNDCTDEFTVVLNILNELYHTSFNENDKRFFPPVFTSEFISSIVKECMSKLRITNLTDALRHNDTREEISQNRDEYATGEYYCILKQFFDIALTEYKIYTDAQIATEVKLHKNHISRRKKEIYKILKERCKEWGKKA